MSGMCRAPKYATIGVSEIKGPLKISGQWDDLSEPPVGTVRVHVLMRAMEPMRKGTLVRELQRPRCGVKAVKSNRHTVRGVALSDCLKNETVWVSTSGPVSVMCEETRR